MKKLLKFIPILVFALVLTSCSSVRVATDYDREANFDQYKTFAFFKPGIDKAEISDLDKRRILRAIETELLAKGYTKSEDPDRSIRTDYDLFFDVCEKNNIPMESIDSINHEIECPPCDYIIEVSWRYLIPKEIVNKAKILGFGIEISQIFENTCLID